MGTAETLNNTSPANLDELLETVDNLGLDANLDLSVLDTLNLLGERPANALAGLRLDGYTLAVVVATTDGVKVVELP